MIAHPFAPRSESLVATPLVCALVLVSTLGLPTAAFSADQPPPKVKAILELLERNPSPQAFRGALKQAGLSRAETQELANEIKKPRYDTALRSLRLKAEAENFGRLAPQPVPRVFDLQALRQTIRQEHTARLASLQAQAQGALQQARVRAAAGLHRPDPLVVARMAAFSGARASAPASPVYIHRTDPEPAITGIVLVILGFDFGAQGDVTIIVGAEDPRPENAFDCRITGWGPEAIHVVVPTEIEELHRSRPFPNAQRSALVWVKPRGDPSGRWRPITVKLNPDHFVPDIESVSPGELTPGLRFAIRGRNLSAGSEPRVTLRQPITGQEARLQVTGYDMDWVEVLVPESLSRFRPGRVTLNISNGLAESRPHGADFIPVEDVLDFSRGDAASCWSLLGTFTGGFIEGLCWLGEERRYRPFESIAHDGVTATRLANDWTVASAVATESGREGRGAGCYLEHAPATGATEFATTELVSWANAYCRVTCTATLTIRGPRGVPISR